MEAIILLAWTIWSARNDLIFKGIQILIPNCRKTLIKEVGLLLHRVKSSSHAQPQLVLWVKGLFLSLSSSKPHALLLSFSKFSSSFSCSSPRPRYFSLVKILFFESLIKSL
jgi:hypothetical protein